MEYKSKLGVKFNRPVLTSNDHFGSIDRGGFNRLKPAVKTGGGRLVPTLVMLDQKLGHGVT